MIFCFSTPCVVVRGRKEREILVKSNARILIFCFPTPRAVVRGRKEREILVKLSLYKLIAEGYAVIIKFECPRKCINYYFFTMLIADTKKFLR